MFSLSLLSYYLSAALRLWTLSDSDPGNSFHNVRRRSFWKHNSTPLLVFFLTFTGNCQFGARMVLSGARIDIGFFSLARVKNRRLNGGIRGPNCRINIFWKRIFGSDLFQFYGRYFYYKYRHCISVDREIEGWNKGLERQQQN